MSKKESIEKMLIFIICAGLLFLALAAFNISSFSHWAQSVLHARNDPNSQYSTWSNARFIRAFVVQDLFGSRQFSPIFIPPFAGLAGLICLSRAKKTFGGLVGALMAIIFMVTVFSLFFYLFDTTPSDSWHLLPAISVVVGLLWGVPSGLVIAVITMTIDKIFHVNVVNAG